MVLSVTPPRSCVGKYLSETKIEHSMPLSKNYVDFAAVKTKLYFLLQVSQNFCCLVDSTLKFTETNFRNK